MHKLQVRKRFDTLEDMAFQLCVWHRFCVNNCVTKCWLIAFSRSSLSGWSVGSQEAALQDVDYISFLFSTLTGFSSDKLASLQEAGDDIGLPPSPLSPLSLYPTPLEQFTHHWDVVEVCSLHTLQLQVPQNSHAFLLKETAATEILKRNIKSEFRRDSD